MNTTRRTLVILCLLCTSALAGLSSYYSMRDGHAFTPGALASLALLVVFAPIVYTAWPVPVGIVVGLFALLMQWPVLYMPTAIPRHSRILAWSCLGFTPLYFLCLALFTFFPNRVLVTYGGLHMVWLTALAVLAVGIRRWPSGFLNVVFHGVLYGGLFYCAFPYLPWIDLEQ